MRRGGKLEKPVAAYETWGELTPERDNAIVIFTGLSPSAHASSSPKDKAPGWWEEMVGPSRPVDTRRFFVICINSLGSCFGSTGPASIDPASGEPYRLNFPVLTLEDIAGGSEKTIEFTRQDTCTSCSGSGSAKGKAPGRCSTCGGSGQVQKAGLGGFFQMVSTCPQCRGAGQVITNPCRKCRGTGLVAKKRTVSVKIPAGVHEGQGIRVTGEGEVQLPLHWRGHVQSAVRVPDGGIVLAASFSRAEAAGGPSGHTIVALIRAQSGGAKVSPLEFTSKILIDEWTLAPDEEEITVMRVTVTGDEDGARKTYVYHLYDEYDAATGQSSMARTTGYACTAAAQLVLDGLFTEKGVFPGELVGKHQKCFESMLAYMEQRGIHYRKEERTGDS